MGSFSIAGATVFILLISSNSIAANAGVESYKNMKPDHFMPGTVLVRGRIRRGGFFLPPSPAANLKKGVGETPPIRAYPPPEPPSVPTP